MGVLEVIREAKLSKGKNMDWRDIGIGAAIGTCNVMTEAGTPASVCFYWAVAAGDQIETGRDLLDFREFCLKMAEAAAAHIVMMVQDTADFFQFVRKYFDIVSIFAAQERTPLEALLCPGLHLRSGYDISGMTLQENAFRLGKFQVKTPSTEFPPHGPGSAISLDVAMKIDEEARTMAALCTEHIHRADGAGHIPLTKTGYVRRYLRDRILYGRGKGTKRIDRMRAADYRKMIRGAIMTPEEYKILRNIIGGGICTANPAVLKQVIVDPVFFDRKSAYPAHMVYDYVPNGICERFERPDMEDVREWMKKRCTAGIFVFKGLRARFPYFAYIRASYADQIAEPVGLEVAAGYVRGAEEIALALTELDFQSVEECYKYDSVECVDCVVYLRGKLPNIIRKYTLARFRGKEAATTPEEKRVQKEMLNSISGIMIMDPVRTEYGFDTVLSEWTPPEEPDLQEAIENYNTSLSRFTRFPWGIWIVAHCRRTEWRAWMELMQQFYYGDTDSVSFEEVDSFKHRQYFRAENEIMEKKAEKASRELGVSIQFFKPFGKLLGSWCETDLISRMCILGQKNYIQESRDGGLKVVMAGVNPLLSTEYVRRRYVRKGVDAVEAFSTTTFYPGRYRDKETGEVFSATGRRITLHHDDEIEGDFLDAAGERQHFVTLSGSIKMFIPVTRRDLKDYEERKHAAGIDILPRAAILREDKRASRVDQSPL